MSNDSNRVRPQLEPLEDRAVPAAHGIGGHRLLHSPSKMATHIAMINTTALEQNEGETADSGTDTDTAQDGQGSQTADTGDTEDTTDDGAVASTSVKKATREAVNTEDPTDDGAVAGAAIRKGARVANVLMTQTGGGGNSGHHGHASRHR